MLHRVLACAAPAATLARADGCPLAPRRYSVLTRPSLRERAQEMGMEDILRAAMEHANETFARQIQYILEQLK